MKFLWFKVKTLLSPNNKNNLLKTEKYKHSKTIRNTNGL